MLTKLYEEIKKYIKKEYKFLIGLIIAFLLFTIKLPYYIDMPGGVINISERKRDFIFIIQFLTLNYQLSIVNSSPS